MATVPSPITIDQAFDDPAAIRRMVERNGPYPSIASYLPPSATSTSGDEAADPGTTLPWFRGNWAANGEALFPDAEAILHNPRFAEAAAKLFAVPEVVPTTVVVNVNAPMPAGAVHVDIPSFRGANRDRYSLRVLQAMGTSGLFEQWRVVEAGAVSWFYDGLGGAYDYWPDGLTGAMLSKRPPFDNVALVADNDRMFHRIGWVGDPTRGALSLPASATIHHPEGTAWTIVDGDRTVATYPDPEVRISILWKARVPDDHTAGALAAPLSEERIIAIFAADLSARGIDAPPSASPLTDERWVDVVHATYYPRVVAD